MHSSPLPAISVVVPCYKVRAFVVDAVRSLFRQTLQEPFEIVLVDDGDPDNSIEEVKKVEAEKPAHITLRYLRREHNGGLSAARNTGTDAARGQYILYLDSDDELYPEALSLLLTEARIHGAVVTLGLARMVDPDNLEQIRPSSTGYMNNLEALSSFLQYDIDVVAWNKLVPLSFLREKQVRFVEGLLHEDEVWSLDLLLAGADIMGTPHITYKYKIGREGSIMEQNNWRHYQSCIEVCNHNANTFEASPYKEMQAVHNRLASCAIYYIQPILEGIAQKSRARRIPEYSRLASATLEVSPTLLYHWRRARGRRARTIACVLSLPVPRSLHVGLLALFFFLLSLKIKV